MTDEDQRAALYNAALETDVTELAVGWLGRAHLLLMVAGHDVDAAKSVVNKSAGFDAAAAEFQTLTDEEKIAFRQVLGAEWGQLVGLAVSRMWHTAGTLGIDPESLDPMYVAFTAAGLINSDEGAEVFRAIGAHIRGEPVDGEQDAA
jgi:hypothetical protein